MNVRRTLRWTSIVIPATLALVFVTAMALRTLRNSSGGDDDAGEAQPHPRPTWAFYQPPEPLPREPPGTLIRSGRAGAAGGVTSWRILYHSRDRGGADIAVSGAVIVPPGPTPSGGRPVVAWAHGTDGSADSCAPSTDPQPADSVEDASALLAAGYIVVATDYQGLGTPGPLPYLDGVSEAHTILDSVRAARRLTSSAGAGFVVFGHSEGGHAALYTGALARSYAPDLRLLGVAAASPPTDLPALGANLDRLDYGSAYLMWLAAGIDEAQVATIVTGRGRQLVHLVEDSCSDAFVAAFHNLTVKDVFRYDPRATAPWAQALAARDTPILPTGLPVLIMQGARDPIVVSRVTGAAADRLCRAGDTVDYHEYAAAAHNVVPAAAHDLNAWLAARFGTPSPAPSRCMRSAG